MGKPLNEQPSKDSLSCLTNIAQGSKVTELSAAQQNLFNFLKLIVDIKYRNKYGSKIEHREGKGYSTYGD